MNVDVDWLKPDMENYTIVGGKPEYCFSVIDGVGLGQKPEAPRTVAEVEDARKQLAAASVQARMLALLAMQERAEEIR